MSNRAWKVEPNEALDLTFFVNAISPDEFYNAHYQDVQIRWLQILSESEYSRITKITQILPVSALATVFSTFNVNTLEDIIEFLTHMDESYQANVRGTDYSRIEGWFKILCNHRDDVVDSFHIIQQHNIHLRWRESIQPQIKMVTEQYTHILSELYSLQSFQLLISKFLGEPEVESDYSIYMCTYIKPIAVQLSQNAMAVHQGPPGYMPLLSNLLSVIVHESLHGFKGTDEAQREQNIYLEKYPPLMKKYEEMITTWKSGPEEFFVIAAETYITEKLGIRSYAQCINYLRSQNGGMPFSEAIYIKLRNEKPETKPEWNGYGDWLVHVMRNNELINFD